MTKVGIVTYLRDDEVLTTELIDICKYIKSIYPNTSLELYSSSIDEKKYPQVESLLPINYRFQRGTKYRKLLKTLNSTDYEYVITLDNDISANKKNLLKMINDTIEEKYDIAWGKIYSRNLTNMVSKLVMVDKLLSHDILRPLLWRAKIGATIPGQCFILRTKCFSNRLPLTDTFLDDLSIGAFTVKNSLKYYYFKRVIAYEIPSYTFKDLLNQRKRWAMGFKQSLSCKTLTRKNEKLLWIHALTYHLIPIIYWISLIVLVFVCPIIAAILIFLVSIILSSSNLNYIIYAMLYQIIFPIFHVAWLITFLKYKL
ncbi:glycosyltransferase family 2 protein [uncultured Psychrobacter sp.]|uniref:glycosyltransferase n=1 Tax=uncultured Psychrobacter sp. TaxID=259303 RepID=UPI00259A90FA|nr:glycosyltransferase family 2 protein [uncultured Psychrobacter sp.]